MERKVSEKEFYTAVFPRVRAKPSQLVRLRALASSFGYGKKIGEFIRLRALGEKIDEKPEGMPRQEVIAGMADLAKLRSMLIDRPDLLPLINRLSQRHLNALRDDPKIQHTR